MKNLTRLSLALGLICTLLAPAQAQTQTELALQDINHLAQVNGQALACQELQIAGRAKALMISHAPKTARFGSAYEEGTQQSYTAQIKGAVACPDGATLSAQLDMLAQRLQTSLPALAPGATSNSFTETQ